MRSASIVGLMTALSRVLGLVREMVMGFFFGTSALKSAFDVAFVVPNLFRRLFGEGAFTSAFIPVFGELIEKRGREHAFTFAWKVVSLLTVFLAAVVLLGVLATWPLERLLPENSRWVLPLPMIRIMLPYALLICVTAVYSGILNSCGKFAIPAFVPVLLNVVWIGALVGLVPLWKDSQTVQMRVLCWSVLAAGVFQFVFQLPLLKQVGGRIVFSLKGVFSTPEIRRVLLNMAPAAIGAGLVQINVCLDKTLAFWADASGPAALEYAERLVYLPMGMFATAFVTVLLPTFSRQAAAGEVEAMGETLERAMRQLALIMAPCSLALIFLARPVIQLIYGFEGGHFDATSVTLSARALAGYAPGLIFFSFYKTLAPAFYGLQDLKTPVKVSMCGIAVNVVSDFVSIWLLPVGWKHVGIAISTTLASLFTGSVLAVILYRRIRAPRLRTLLPPVAKMVGCSVAMAAVAWSVHGPVLRFSAAFLAAKLAEIVAMGATVAAGMGVYFALMTVLDRADLASVLHDLRRRR